MCSIYLNFRLEVNVISFEADQQQLIINIHKSSSLQMPKDVSFTRKFQGPAGAQTKSTHRGGVGACEIIFPDEDDTL